MATLPLGVSIVAFTLISVSPIDPVQANVGTLSYMRMTPEKRQNLRPIGVRMCLRPSAI